MFSLIILFFAIITILIISIKWDLNIVRLVLILFVIPVILLWFPYIHSYEIMKISDLSRGIPYTVLAATSKNEKEELISLGYKEKGFILNAKKGDYIWPVGKQIVITKNQKRKLSVYTVGSIEPVKVDWLKK